MKRIHKISAVLFILTAAAFTSCSSDNEPIDPAIIVNPGPDPNDPGESSGDYWPTAINNQWVFTTNGVVQAPMKIVSINTVAGNEYYTFNSQSGTGSSGLTGNAVMRLRKEGGNYYLRREELVVAPAGGMPGSTTSGSEVIILKDNVPANTTWTESYTQTTTYTDPAFPAISMQVNAVNKILETGGSVVSNGVTYADVIKTKLTQSVTFNGVTTVTTVFYWFAKDVGLVKYIMDSGTQISTSELQSFVLN
ncbi:MAG: hypothetical protein EOO51_07250 [Flavobacterium sp.]|nr:MAG: hypothetical protein EOO51_07250 [Flavobacterium sp.]